MLARFCVVLLVVAACGLRLHAQAVDSVPTDGYELSAWLQERLPRSAYYELLLDGNRPGNLARRLIVYDVSSGDLLGSSAGAILVRDGSAAKVVVDGDSIRDVSDEGVDLLGGGPPNLGDDLPILYAVWLLENPELVTLVEAQRSDVLSVEVLYPHDRFGEPEFPYSFEIGSDGAVLRAWTPGSKASSKRPKVFDYDETFPRSWMVLSDEYHAWNWDVERRVVQDAAPADAFTDAAVAKLIREADTDYRAWSPAQLAARRAADGLEPVPLDPTFAEAVRQAKGSTPQWRNWLVGGGVVILGVGIVLWWRRKS